MKNKTALFLLLALALSLCLAACGGGDAPDTPGPSGPEEIPDVLPLAVDGVSDYVIVRGENASESEITAAAEFQSYFAKITGAELPVVTDAEPAAAREIVVGKTNRETAGEFDRDELGDDGFVIKTGQGKLWLVGSEERSTLYAVYSFLEDYLGCRFYTADFEKIPETATVALQPIAQDKQIPVFEVRRVWWLIAASSPSYSAKRHVNSGVGENPGNGFHTLAGLAGITEDCTDPCLTDENTYTAVLASVRAWLDAHPEADVVSVSQCDGGESGMCHCENCMAEVEEYGWSGHYLLFVNRIAQALRDDYPNVRIHTFAYQTTVDPPKGGIRAADNITFQLCSSTSCFLHPFEECTRYFGVDGQESSDFAAALRGWSEASDYLSVWDYTINFYAYGAPYPSWAAMLPNARLMADSNVKSYWAFGCTGSIGGEFDCLRVYMMCKVAWDPYMTQDEYYAVMDEFLADYYGPGWQNIRDFIDLSVSEAEHLNCAMAVSALYPTTIVERDASAAADMTPEQLRQYKKQDWTPYYEAVRTALSMPLLEQGYALFDAALAAAVTDGQKWNLERSRLQLDTVKSFWLYDYYKCAADSAYTVYANTVRAMAAQGKFTTVDANKLTKDFKEYITDKLKGEYIKYNYAFAKDLIAYNCASVKEGLNLHGREALAMWNFTVPPFALEGSNAIGWALK